MNRRRIGVILIGAGIVIAALVGFVVYQTSVEAETLRAAQPKTWTVVAKIAIPARTVILDEQIDIIKVQDEAIPTTAAVARPARPGEDASDADKSKAKGQVVGQVAGLNIARGEVISLDHIGKAAAQVAPALDIPAGKVWYQFPVTVRGGNPANDRILITFLDLVRAGDSVDVYYTSIEGGVAVEGPANTTTDALRQLYTRRILQNIKVQNVGNYPVGTVSPREERFISFEVTPDEALRLKWLKDAASITGNIELVVRSPLDSAVVLPNTAVSFDVISGETGIGTGR